MQGCPWHTFHPKGKETIAIRLWPCMGQGTFAGHCDLWREAIVGGARFDIFLPRLCAGCVAGGVLNGSAGHSPPLSLGFNGKCGFVLLPPEVHRALKDRVEMLIRQWR